MVHTELYLEEYSTLVLTVVSMSKAAVTSPDGTAVI